MASRPGRRPSCRALRTAYRARWLIMCRAQTTRNEKSPGLGHDTWLVDRRCLNRVTSGLRLLEATKMRSNQPVRARLKSMSSLLNPHKQKAARQLCVATSVNFGSPTWARTRDLRINSLKVFYPIGIDRHIRNQQIAEQIAKIHATLQLTALIHICRCAIIWVTRGLPVGYGLRVSPGYDWLTSFREDHHG